MRIDVNHHATSDFAQVASLCGELTTVSTVTAHLILMGRLLEVSTAITHLGLVCRGYVHICYLDFVGIASNFIGLSLHYIYIVACHRGGVSNEPPDL